MIKLKLVSIENRFATMLERIMSATRSRLAAALALSVVLGVGTLCGVSVAVAQDNGQMVTPTTVNINAADAEALAATLEGVGHSRALEIVRYREAYGPFTAVEELADVKGIGPSTLAKNVQVITLD